MLRRLYNLFHHHYHRRYHGVYRRAPQLFAFDLTLLVSIIFLTCLTAWFFWWRPGFVGQVEIEISLGSERLKSGDRATISINYFNHGKEPLTGNLFVRLPKGFNLETTPGANQVFSINNLPPGGEGNLKLSGTFWTNLDKEEKIIASIVSTPQPGKTETNYGTILLDISDSVLSSSLAVSSSAFGGQPLPFRYSLINNGPSPTSFSLSSNFPTTLNHKQPFSLAPGTMTIVTGTVQIPKNASNFIFKIKPVVTANGELFDQKISVATIAVYSPQVFISTNFPSTTNFAEPGATVPVEISWQNKNSWHLKNQVIRLSFPVGIVDLAATAKNNHWRLDGAELIIDQDFDVQAGTIDADLKLLPKFSSIAEDQTNFAVRANFEGTIDQVPGQTYAVASNIALLPLATEVSLAGETRYYSDDGDQLGRGPLPPRVGKTTKYWIFISVGNTTNPLQNAKLTIELAPGIQFTGKQSVTVGPEIRFNVGQGVWGYSGQLAPHSQNGFYFEVAVTPNADQIGKNIPLIKNIAFTATDDRVGEQFNLESEAADNTLAKSDPGATKGALVQP